MFKKKANKKSSFNIGSFLFLVGAVYLIGFVLVTGDMEPISIASMACSFNHWAKHRCVLAAGLLPICVSLMIFGTAIVGSFVGSLLHRWVIQIFKK